MSEEDRDETLVTRTTSAQSRAGNVLAFMLMGTLGLGALSWYYANAIGRADRTKERAQAAAVQRAEGDAPLPSLGRIAPPSAVHASPAAPLVNEWSLGDGIPPPGMRPPADMPPPVRVLDEIPLASNGQNLAAASTSGGGAAPPKTAEELRLERELSGSAYVAGGLAEADRLPDKVSRSPAAAMPSRGGELGPLLSSNATNAVRAQRLAETRLLLPKGAFIDCTLETAVDSTLPGMTTCITATDTFGVDGKVVLMERGTKLIGETRGEVQQGAARIFVLWTEARTPVGVIVPLDSPGADELGRSGLPGEINTHFWQRFGAAMLVSVIDGGVQAAAQSARGGNGTVVVNPSSSQGVLTEILHNTVNIRPTVVKRNGDRIQVLVARDLDFRSVYELRAADR